jgi:GNAT superfamily N-acetyltransferase
MQPSLTLPDFLIRPATPADVAAVSRHRCQMWLAMKDLAPDHYDDMYRRSLEYFQQALEEGTYRGWVVVLRQEQGTLTGGGGLVLRRIPPFPEPDGRVCASDEQAHILNVFVEEQYRGLGLAKALMETILDWCRRQGIGSVTLNASSAGKPLYEQLHFTEVQNFMKWKST